VLTCQLIVALVSAVKRFDAVLHRLPSGVRRVIARVRTGGSDFQET
jgi:hypothetical protein